MNHNILTTKARTLENLTGILKKFQIPDLKWYTVKEWEADPDALIKDIQNSFGKGSGAECKLLAVRSSAMDEDGEFAARAGEFDSVLDVPSDNPESIQSAIEKVVESFRKNGSGDKENEIIVQRMLQQMSMSGVVFTHDLNTGAPYYVINYDDVSGRTDTVTSGESEHANRTLYIHRGAFEALRSERFRNLIEAIQELEQVMESQFLDIEFAMGEDLVPQLLQVRAITTQPNWNRAVARRVDAALEGIQNFVRQRFQPMQDVYGDSTVLGQMPDWNPAEMIGRAPRRLAFSLYEVLITDHAWRQAREVMGYAVPGGQPLMVSLAGQPYIDTRFSFHSYLPAELPADIGRKLVNRWVEKLRENPQLHDKVEFDVAITTWSFDLDEKLDELVGDTLDPKERQKFKESLQKLTVDLVSGNSSGSIGPAMERIHHLEQRQKELALSPEQLQEDDGVSLSILHRLIDECIRYGTIPFSILARHGFIARTLLLSLQKRGIFTADEVQQIQAGIQTVAGDLVDDMVRLQRGEIPRDMFMKTYGHLRPGTYDILSLRYDQIDQFGSGGGMAPEGDLASHEPYELSDAQIESINRLLQQNGIDAFDARNLMAYIGEATAGREYGKFVFTRTVSDMLELIAKYGELNGLSRDELSHISVRDLLRESVWSGEGSAEDRLREISEEGAEYHAVTNAIRLPQILFDEEGVHVVPFQVSHPNFITDKRIVADAVWLQPGDTAPSLTGQIVLIESADPGFDWIFAHNIGGLITKYGGANSHMAIRCAEFGIPAAIGCGEQKFERAVTAETISLDCAAGLIQVQV